jgi:hypothetical protein
VGKGEKRRLTNSLVNLEVNLDQQGVMTEEDQKCILIIGGIEIFLPSYPVQERAHVVDAAIEGHPTKTVKDEEKE